MRIFTVIWGSKPTPLFILIYRRKSCNENKIAKAAIDHKSTNPQGHIQAID